MHSSIIVILVLFPNETLSRNVTSVYLSCSSSSMESRFESSSYLPGILLLEGFWLVCCKTMLCFAGKIRYL